MTLLSRISLNCYPHHGPFDWRLWRLWPLGNTAPLQHNSLALAFASRRSFSFRYISRLPSSGFRRQEFRLCPPRAAAAIARVDVCTVDELRELDDWLNARTKAAQPKNKIPRSEGRIVVEERKAPTDTYQLELVKCGKGACKVCARGPAHGPYTPEKAQAEQEAKEAPVS